LSLGTLEIDHGIVPFAIGFHGGGSEIIQQEIPVAPEWKEIPLEGRVEITEIIDRAWRE
jgi:hypothetical protein